MTERTRRIITFPAKITKRGNMHYISILKAHMEMLGASEGDMVDVTIRVLSDEEMNDVE